ncbi:MAG: hypothetical protein LBC47_09685, partial [Tannerella sp.]|nr:hypothetical protein [Tannerella sp.]
ENSRELGVYFLGTSLKNRDEAAMWMIYSVIREVEYTFSVLKTDLDLRQVWVHSPSNRKNPYGTKSTLEKNYIADNKEINSS